MLRRRGTIAVGAALAAMLLIGGCSEPAAGTEPSPSESESPSDEATTATEPATQDPTTDATTEPTDQATDDGAAAAFLAWLEASRIPEVDEACAAMSDELVEEMLAEMQADGFPDVATCEEMITLTADLYRAFGTGAEVDIDVQSETDTDATLFVTYLDSGDCGTVVLERIGGRWVMNELTEECPGR